MIVGEDHLAQTIGIQTAPRLATVIVEHTIRECHTAVDARHHTTSSAFCCRVVAQAALVKRDLDKICTRDRYDDFSRVTLWRLATLLFTRSACLAAS